MPRAALTDDKRAELRAIGKRLRQLREARYGGYRGPGSRSETAGMLGVGVGTYNNWERGNAMPIDMALRLIVATAVNPWWLLTGAGPMFAPLSVVSGQLSAVEGARGRSSLQLTTDNGQLTKHD